MKTLAELKAQVAELQEQIRKMEEESPSPGPWRISIDVREGIYVDDSFGNVVVLVVPTEKRAANTRLVEKAPELLEVAVAVVEGNILPRSPRARKLVEYIAPHLLVKP